MMSLGKNKPEMKFLKFLKYRANALSLEWDVLEYINIRHSLWG